MQTDDDFIHYYLAKVKSKLIQGLGVQLCFNACDKPIIMTEHIAFIL